MFLTTGVIKWPSCVLLPCPCNSRGGIWIDVSEYRRAHTWYGNSSCDDETFWDSWQHLKPSTTYWSEHSISVCCNKFLFKAMCCTVHLNDITDQSFHFPIYCFGKYSSLFIISHTECTFQDNEDNIFGFHISLLNVGFWLMPASRRCFQLFNCQRSPVKEGNWRTDRALINNTENITEWILV